MQPDDAAPENAVVAYATFTQLQYAARKLPGTTTR